MGSRIPALPAALLAALVLAAAAPATAGATMYLVDGQPDGATLPGGKACNPPIGPGSTVECATIRGAIIAADAAVAGGTKQNTIELGYGTSTLTIPPSGSDDATTGDLNVAGDMTIIGAGPAASVIDAMGVDRVFSVPDGASLTIHGVGLMDGKTGPASKPDAAGGAIEALGGANVSLDNVAILKNTATGAAGGGIAAGTGAVSISRAWIEGNHSGGDGGGVFLAAPSALTINASAIDGNSATGNGGGLDFTASGNTSMTNTTIFNNSAGVAGGGIYAALNAGQFTVDNATIVQGTAATSGGNIRATGGGGISLENTIVGAGKTGAAANNCDIAATGVDAGHNMFFDLPYTPLSTDNCLAGPPPSSDIRAGDVRLAQGPGVDHDDKGALRLAFNGGPTPTLALSAGSPAFNAADAAGCTGAAPLAAGVDERGSTRFPLGISTCDIGAEEPEAVLALAGTVTPTTGSVGKQLTFDYTVTNTGPSIATGMKMTGTLPGGALDVLSVAQGSCSFFGGLNCTLADLLNTRSNDLTVIVTPGAPGTYSMTATASDAESGATQPVTLSANVTGTAPAATPGGGPPATPAPGPSAASSTKKPASKCGSLRAIRIHVQNAAKLQIVSAQIYYLGKLRATIRKPHLAATINLKTRPAGTYVIKIVGRQSNGHTVVGKRVYHPCNANKLPGHKHFKL